jgi:hypothetical protein
MLANGDLVAGGSFTQMQGVPASSIARWDGTSWSALGLGLTGGVVEALRLLPNGDLIVGGGLTGAGGAPVNGIARWNGTSWAPLGTGLSSALVTALAVTGTGDVLVGGNFAQAGGVVANGLARWDGVSWSALGGGIGAPWLPLAITTLPNGDVVVAGNFPFISGVAANAVARWDGATWSALGSGFPLTSFNSAPLAMCSFPDGRLIFGGAFLTAGGFVSLSLATYASTCPATAASTSPGCAGAHGTAALTALDRPWLGGTFHARGSNLPPVAIVAVGTGLIPVQVPVGLLLPPSPANCTFALQYDFIGLQLVTTGGLDVALPLPNVPAFAGTVVYQQLLVLELDASSQFVENTVSNALTLTCGAF